ncbi:MAG: hypothetical protein OXG36_03010 [Caldilineaceae bacterium]|nr:hypothetical protein [Caldilineaceae bacterium]
MLQGEWFRPVAGGEVEAQRDHSATPAEMAAAVVVRLDQIQGSPYLISMTQTWLRKPGAGTDMLLKAATHP